MILAACLAITAVLGNLWLSADAARDRRWSDALGWLLAAAVFFAFAGAMVWLDIKTRESECRMALATENAHRHVDGHRPLPDTCTDDPDQFKRRDR